MQHKVYSSKPREVLLLDIKIYLVGVGSAFFSDKTHKLVHVSLFPLVATKMDEFNDYTVLLHQD